MKGPAARVDGDWRETAADIEQRRGHPKAFSMISRRWSPQSRRLGSVRAGWLRFSKSAAAWSERLRFLVGHPFSKW
jgi:hypothetical protein